MNTKYPVESTVIQRRSVRTYEEHSFTKSDEEIFTAYIKEMENPFQSKPEFRFIHKELSSDGEKLGTYGVIKGADTFIGAKIQPAEHALVALGYSFEDLVLFGESAGYGTCFLGGTFNRGAFGKAMDLAEGDLFPCISPVGRKKEKRSFADSLARFIAKSDQRKGFSDIFFQDDFSRPLTETEAGEYVYPLEMLRLAPSAANKQPWRVVKVGKTFHFYENQTLGEHQPGVDLQKVDMGIGICHFHKALLEKNESGSFVTRDPGLEMPAKHTYIISWQSDEII